MKRSNIEYHIIYISSLGSYLRRFISRISKVLDCRRDRRPPLSSISLSSRRPLYAVNLDPLQLIVHGDWVSETLAGSASTSKALTFVQLPRKLPLADLAVVSGPHISPTTPPSYYTVNARGTISSSSVSQGTSGPINHLRLTATSSS